MIYKLRHFFFCIRWLSKHRSWANTRQKFQAMEREFERAKR